jgi:hypothetical protein
MGLFVSSCLFDILRQGIPPMLVANVNDMWTSVSLNWTHSHNLYVSTDNLAS